MRPYLLDTNLLIALAWPNHVHHQEALVWFVRKGAAGFRTCPLTQTGFVRISSNPVFTPAAVSPGEALSLFDRIARLPGHDFWPDDLPLSAVFAEQRQIYGHRQITDAYLVALASGRGGVLATLDRGVAALGSPQNVEVVFAR